MYLLKQYKQAIKPDIIHLYTYSSSLPSFLPFLTSLICPSICLMNANPNVNCALVNHPSIHLYSTSIRFDIQSFIRPTSICSSIHPSNHHSYIHSFIFFFPATCLTNVNPIGNCALIKQHPSLHVSSYNATRKKGFVVTVISLMKL